MGKKIFVSYKYEDTSVYGSYGTKVRDYVDEIETKLDKSNHIYKGEHDGEDLSEFKEETIWTKLKDRIFDSSITVVLISRNMKELFTPDSEQWIPWEISYSLKEMTRKSGDRKSLSNGIVCVVLPDQSGSYDYYINNKSILLPYNSNLSFDIINKNRANHKKEIFKDYIVTVKWDDFINDIDYYINQAVEKQNHIDEYEIYKSV